MANKRRNLQKEAAMMRLVVVHGVPVTLLAEATGLSRQTIYRHMNRAKTAARENHEQALRQARQSSRQHYSAAASQPSADDDQPTQTQGHLPRPRSDHPAPLESPASPPSPRAPLSHRRPLGMPRPPRRRLDEWNLDADDQFELLDELDEDDLDDGFQEKSPEEDEERD